MKKVAKKVCVVAAILIAGVADAAERYVPEYLIAVSVTVRAERGYQKSEGSGSLFVRQVGDNNVTYCWTAGHVVEHMKKIEESIVGGKPIKRVSFENPKLVRELRNKDGRRTGEIVVDAKILRYSPAEKHDLCLMVVLSESFKATASVEFLPKSAKLIRIGAHINHVGSFLGSDGASSYSDGVISAHGRILFKQPFCQSTAPAYPGSSGGQISDDRGRFVAMLVRGAGSDYNLSVPVARMWKWAEENKVEWAMNPALKITQKEIDALPIEGPAASTATAKGGKHKDYPFLIKRTGFRDE